MCNLAVLYYARKHCNNTWKDVPWKLCILPLGLLVSTALFFGAYVITETAFGRTSLGAILKHVLWAIALLVEAITHICMFESNWSGSAPFCMGVRQRKRTELFVPYSDVGARERLTDITTIILGEVSWPVPLTLCNLLNFD
jgi:hypothetical protein